jgi:tRNA dimethylallyltransferase
MKLRNFLKSLSFLRKKIKIIAIVGPTASGKTDLSIKIAKYIDGEIISADSRQMYKELTHGSGKILESEKENITHYCLDIFSIFDGQKSVTDWRNAAQDAIDIITSKNKTPIVVGGTMHFIDTLLFNKQFSNVLPNENLRNELQNKSCEELVKLLEKLDSTFSEKIDKKNKVRLVRAIEIATEIGSVPPVSENSDKYNIIWLGILPDAKILRERIDLRLEKRWNSILEEVRDLLNKKINPELLISLGLEYKYSTLFLQNKISENEAKQEIKLKSWQYAKRQMTWWKRNKNIKWFPSGDEAFKYFKKHN